MPKRGVISNFVNFFFVNILKIFLYEKQLKIALIKGKIDNFIFVNFCQLTKKKISILSILKIIKN